MQLLLALALSSYFVNAQDIVIAQARREIDLKGTVIRETFSASIYNTLSADLITLDFAVHSAVANHMSHLQITQKGHEAPLLFAKETENCKFDAQCFRATLAQPIKPGSKLVFHVKSIYGRSLFPFPRLIKQGEDQIVKFLSNLVAYSPYMIENQKLTVKYRSKLTCRFPNQNIQMFTKAFDASLNGADLLYSISEAQQPFSFIPFEAHFTYKKPLVIVEKIHKKVEISPLKGTVDVTERFHVRNDGAAIHSDFSRGIHNAMHYNGRETNFLNELAFIYPNSMDNHVLKDDLGYNYSKHIKLTPAGKKVSLKPRYPIGGSWRYEWYQAYTLDLKEFLYKNGETYHFSINNFNLFDDVLVENLTFEFVLPEGAVFSKIDCRKDFVFGAISNERGFLEIQGRTKHFLHFTNLTKENIEMLNV